MSSRLCETCGAERARYARECDACYHRRYRRENPEAAERSRAVSRAWKDRNRSLNRARDRAHKRAQRVPCPGCGGTRKPDSAVCQGCRSRAAEDRRTLIVRLYSRGDSLKAIAAEIGTTVDVIGTDLDRLRKAGRIGRRRSYTRRSREGATL